MMLLLAAVAVPATAAAAGVDPAAATSVQREQAQSRFARGRRLYNSKKYEAALAEFRSSLDIVASPNTRLFAARCLRELGRLVDAYAEFGRTAVEAKELARDDARYTKAEESAVGERGDLAPKLAFVTVTVTNAADGTVLRVGGDEVKRGAWSEPAPVVPGTAEVVAETPGQTPVRTVVTLTAGQTQAVTLDAAPPPPAPVVVAEAPPPEAPLRSGLLPYALVAGGVGALGVATFAIAGSMSKGTYDRLAAECMGRCPADRAGDVSSGRTQQTLANVGLAVGLVGLAAGATLFGLSLTRSSPSAPSAALVLTPTFVGVRGAL